MSAWYGGTNANFSEILKYYMQVITLSVSNF